MLTTRANLITSAAIQAETRDRIAAARAPNTQRAYARAVAEWRAFAEFAPFDAGVSDTEKFQLYLHRRLEGDLELPGGRVLRRFSIALLSQAVAAVAHEIKIDKPDIAPLVRAAKKQLARSRAEPVRRAYPLSPPQVRRMVAEEFGKESPEGARNAALIAVAFAFGLRGSEVQNLKTPEITITGDAVALALRSTKNRPEGFAPPPSVRLHQSDGILKSWLAARSELPGDYLFCSLRGGGGGKIASPNTIMAIVRGAAQAAGIPHRDIASISMHSFRRGRAQELQNEGMPLTAIAQIIGWKTIASAVPYLEATE